MTIDLKKLKTKVSPSHLSRVEKCPASAFISLLAQEHENDYSNEGRTAHAVAHLLGVNYEKLFFGRDYTDCFEEVKDLVYSSEDEQIKNNLKLVDYLMLAHCFEYVVTCFDDNNWVRVKFLPIDKWEEKKSSVIRVFEQSLDYTALANSKIKRKAIVDFAKIINYADGISSVNVLDFKYGFSEVDACDNLQLLAYLILIYDTFKDKIEGETVLFSCGIYQPKDRHKVKIHTLKIDELESYRRRIMEITEKAQQITAPAKPSAEACAHCSGASVCAAPVEELKQNLDKLKVHLKDEGSILSMTSEDMVDIYKILSLYKKYDKVFSTHLKELLKVDALPDSFEYSTRNISQLTNKEGLKTFVDEEGYQASAFVSYVTPAKLKEIMGEDDARDFILTKETEPTIKLKKGF